ncbi:unnamed protein product [Musa acuminata subsp. malaccensis]|uniref:(wild Malaysian banana) hypothetical protein n=1 Tax=Musa acuminata subsp. malaccensis TaxID=214687 RepID=A0A804JEW0_MUSAM|nr:PREDICTED: uncharacterized protein LOC103987361 [Musa acuminata subsp. malaccensis]CAG1845880.1 unnamed protein product [Musa acuminata subsp. malaccensis]
MTTQRPEEPSLAACLSFGGSAASADVPAVDDCSFIIHHDPPRHIEFLEAADEDDADDDSSEDFEFAFVVRDPDASPSITADEIFSGGRIVPAYPVFNRDLLLASSGTEEREAAAEANDMADQIPLRRLLIEEREARSASTSEEPEAVGEYCVWAPDRCKKSASTGSSLRWRLRDLMIGRSQSDGKEKFVYLGAAPPSPQPAKGKIANSTTKGAAATAKRPSRVAQAGAVTGHRVYYGKGPNGQALKAPRRSFLPYRQELFGLFAPVTGLRRSHHPF